MGQPSISPPVVSALEPSSGPSTDVTAPGQSSGVPFVVTPVQTASASGPSSTTTTVLTATQRKFAISSLSSYLSPSTSSSVSSDLPSLASSECIAGRENTGYRLLNMEAIESGLNKIWLCCACHSDLVLKEKFESRKGFVTT